MFSAVPERALELAANPQVRTMGGSSPGEAWLSPRDHRGGVRASIRVHAMPARILKPEFEHLGKAFWRGERDGGTSASRHHACPGHLAWLPHPRRFGLLPG